MSSKKRDKLLATPSKNPFSKLLGDIRSIVSQARQQAYAAVNSAMVESYWQIGRCIVEEEQH